MSEKLDFDSNIASILKNAFVRPTPRLKEGLFLIESGVKTAIDISDGLLADLKHVCDSSHVGANVEIDNVPIQSAVKAAFEEKGLDFGLSGGEDYELLFTAPDNVIEKVKSTVPVTVIGVVTADAGKITLVDKKGKQVTANKMGWDHFKSK